MTRYIPSLVSTNCMKITDILPEKCLPFLAEGEGRDNFFVNKVNIFLQSVKL